MARSNPVEVLLEAYRSGRSLRATSLIISVYGDAIAPRGGTVWLGSLIRLLAPLGLSERLVRTSVYRLSKEGWLDSRQVGRRSYYSLTRTGWRSFERAYERVYSEPRESWDGQWTLVLTAGVPPRKREALRKELATLGFGALSTDVFAHPLPPTGVLNSLLQDLDVQRRIVLMRARNEGLPTSAPLNRLVRECWNLDDLGTHYAAFLDRFRPVWRYVESAATRDPQACVLVRILLIHEIRRLLLRDPQLPQEVLPDHWHGAAARLLCRNLYRVIWRPAEHHLGAVLETAEGPLPEPANYFYERFGGL